MIASKTSALISVTLPSWVTSNRIVVWATSECTLNNIVYDTGDGVRPFRPLIVKIDNEQKLLPTQLSAGRHVIELMGEWFAGVGLELVGIDLDRIAQVDFTPADSVDTASIWSALASKPDVYHGFGPPSTALGKFGDEYHDDAPASSGGQIWYKRGTEEWHERQ